MSGWAHIHFKRDGESEVLSVMTTVRGMAGVRGAAKEILERAGDLPETMILSCANDTSNSGSAEVYELEKSDGRKFDDYTLVEEIEGYEGAMGNDVAGKIRDEYGYRIPVGSWEAYDLNLDRSSDEDKLMEYLRAPETQEGDAQRWAVMGPKGYLISDTGYWGDKTEAELFEADVADRFVDQMIDAEKKVRVILQFEEG